MRIDEKKISEIEVSLRKEIRRLEDEYVHAPHSVHDSIGEQLEAARDRLGVLSQVVLRNATSLPLVQQNVFVSTNLKHGGDPPRWVLRLIEQVNSHASAAGFGTYRFHFGNTVPGGDYQLEIFRRIAESYCFLSLVGAVVDGDVDESGVGAGVVTGYLQEEIGAAFALAKPIVIALPTNIPPHSIGQLYGYSRQRIVYDSSQDHWENVLAENLEKALRVAPQKQIRTIEERRRIISQLV